MDELIAKLRSQVPENNLDNNTQIDSSPVKILKKDNELEDIRTSQSELLPKNTFKLDFGILRKCRGKNETRISELKSGDFLKFNGSIWVIIKSIESYKGINGNVYKWELMDETGVIFSSTTCSDQNINVGSIICITNFSIWRINGNHINIVDRNITEIAN